MNELPSEYERYSLDDLLDIERHLDREKFPARYAALQEEIERRRATSHKSPQIPGEGSDSCSNGCLKGCGAGCGLSLAFAIFIALQAPNDGQTGMVFMLVPPVALTGACIGAFIECLRKRK